jgi:hypothetical protein
MHAAKPCPRASSLRYSPPPPTPLRWEISIKVQESGAFEAFWDALAHIANALVFFFSGVSCVNFFIR